MKKTSKTKTLLRPCPICDSRQGEVLHTQKFLVPQEYLLPAEYDVVACTKCGFTYADTSVGQQDYNRYYQSQSIYEDKKTGRGSGTNEHDLKRLSEIAEEVARSCPDKTARIIEVGCANGGILMLLKRKGYTNLTGVDLSAKCIENVTSHGIAGVQGAISDVGRLLNGQKFDYVILSHIVEHVYDLRGALRQCYDLMDKDATLYLEVPDAARYSDFYIDPYHHFNIEHINHFDEVSLTNIGAVTNFSKRYAGHKTTPVSADYTWPAVFVLFEKAKPLELPLSTEARKSIEAYLELSAKDSCTEIIAELVKTQEELYVFGAGNLTYRLLATTDLPKCNIKAFIDNDSKKQRKLTYGGGKMLISNEICAPKVLAGATGTVVICSVQFTQEIEAQIKSINESLKIVKLNRTLKNNLNYAP
ncbi:MAG: class I SAM-dependent methyltransferase [Prevotellaceae bacterium]|jgi:SAM-dependent methyltransferase|nr:class I SAM-dependent methyltransferase [Prevotellaceae bacterium]